MSGASRAFIRAAVLLLLGPLLPALATALWHPRRPDWAALRHAGMPPGAAEAAALRLDLAELRAAHPDALWIDARPARDYAAAHVPGALALTEDVWEEGFARLVEAWDGAASIVVYCGGEHCRASEAVALRLRRDLGFGRVFVLAGGWEAWQAATGSPQGEATR